MNDNILKGLQELNLKSDLVELAVSDDIRELASEGARISGLQKDGVKWGNRAESEIKEVKKRISDAEGILKGAQRQAAKFLSRSQKVLNAAEVAAKDLGVNPNSIKGYGEANKLRADILDMQNEVSGWLDFLNKQL